VIWRVKRQADGYDILPPESVPVVAFACLVRYRAPTPTEGASVYPACQNLLLAGRAYGYDGVLTGFQAPVEAEWGRRIGIPSEVALCATIRIGWPVGRHGPVGRRPMADIVYGERWGTGASWAIDPGVAASTSGDGGQVATATHPADVPE
jgi:nitroreductase